MRNMWLYIVREYKVRVSGVMFWTLTLAIDIALVFLAFKVGYWLQNLDEIVVFGEESLSSEYVLMFNASALFLLVFYYGVQSMRAVIGLKNDRVVELLLPTMKSWQIVCGLIVAIMLVMLTQVLLWLLSLYAFSLFSDVFSDAVLLLTQSVLSPVSLLSLLGGYVFYAALFALVGAAVSGDGDGQMLTLLISLASSASVVLCIYFLQSPDVAQLSWIYFVPFTSPLLVGTLWQQLAWWHVVLYLCVLWLWAGLCLVPLKSIFSN